MLLMLGNKPPSSWLCDMLRKQGVSFLIKKFEGGGIEDENVSGILSCPTLYALQESFSLRAVMQWLDLLLAALDCYNTFIEQGMVKPNDVLGMYTLFSHYVSFKESRKSLRLYF